MQAGLVSDQNFLFCHDHHVAAAQGFDIIEIERAWAEFEVFEIAHLVLGGFAGGGVAWRRAAENLDSGRTQLDQLNVAATIHEWGARGNAVHGRGADMVCRREFHRFYRKVRQFVIITGG